MKFFRYIKALFCCSSKADSDEDINTNEYLEKYSSKQSSNANHSDSNTSAANTNLPTMSVDQNNRQKQQSNTDDNNSRNIKNVLRAMLPSKNTSVRIFINFCRDITWSFFAYLNYNIKFEEDNNNNQKMLAQWFYTLIAMGIGAGTVGFILYKSNKFDKEDAKKALVSVAGASVAVLTWDQAQILGDKTGRQLSFSKLNAGYFSALFAGGAEGPTQYLVTLIGLFLLLPKERQKHYTNNKSEGMRLFLAELLFNFFPGMIPGGMWQVIFNGNPAKAVSHDTGSKNLAKIAGNSMLIAASVGIFNCVHAKIDQKTIRSHFTHKDKDSDKEPKEPIQMTLN